MVVDEPKGFWPYPEGPCWVKELSVFIELAGEPEGFPLFTVLVDNPGVVDNACTTDDPEDVDSTPLFPLPDAPAFPGPEELAPLLPDPAAPPVEPGEL